VPINPVEVLGFVAGSLTTLAYLPQVVKALRSRHTRDLSLPMYLILAAGVAGWLAYGLLIGSLPVILANAVTLVLVLLVLAMKLRYG
jgi:MtN3 and saliva related transmembrane protein